MPNREHSRFTLRNAKVINRNFSGRKTDFNDEGNRNFCVVLTETEANQLAADGLLVKRDSRIEKGIDIEEGDERAPFLPVHLGYKFKPPRVVMVTPNGNRISLQKEDLSNLDNADIIKADVVINARYWEKPTGSGIKCWVKTLVIWIDEDELEAEYGLNEMLGKHGPVEEPDEDE
jgi:hypothetical protein